MATIAQLTAKIAQFFTASDKAHALINGADDAVVATEAGNLPTMAKALKDFEDKSVRGDISQTDLLIGWRSQAHTNLGTSLAFGTFDPNGAPLGLVSADLGSGTVFEDIPWTGVPLDEIGTSEELVIWSSDREVTPPVSGIWFSVGKVFDGASDATHWSVKHFVDGVMIGSAYNSIDIPIPEYPEGGDYAGSGLVSMSRSTPVPDAVASHVGQWCKASTAWWQWSGSIWIPRFTHEVEPIAYNATLSAYRKLTVTGADGAETITISAL